MRRYFIALGLVFVASTAHADININRQCSWGILSDSTKSTLPQRACTAYAGPNGYRGDKRGTWLAECNSIVTAAIASCDEGNKECLKRQQGGDATKNQICALNARLGAEQARQ